MRDPSSASGAMRRQELETEEVKEHLRGASMYSS